MAGESVLMTFFWECRDGSRCERFTLRLEDEAGATAAEWSLPAIREGFPAGDWPAHGRLRGQHLLRLPASLPGGNYHFVIEEFALGEIAVATPERQFTLPPLAEPLDATFVTADGATIATLAGIASREDDATDSPPPPCTSAPLLPGACSLPLVWRAEAETATSYHVFVHLVDESGNILAQADGVPANWARPTTGWLPGEYVVDTHALTIPADLPPGPLSIRVGLYDPDTGRRLMAGDDDYVTVPVPAQP